MTASRKEAGANVAGTRLALPCQLRTTIVKQEKKNRENFTRCDAVFHWLSHPQGCEIKILPEFVVDNS
jgi:hypothetical protein